jgi:hypothetical protein
MAADAPGPGAIGRISKFSPDGTFINIAGEVGPIRGLTKFIPRLRR